MSLRIDAVCRFMATVSFVLAFVDVPTFVAVSFIARLTFAVRPTGHIDTHSGIVTFSYL